MGDQEEGASKGDILIVDDTLANLRVLSSMLTEQGYKVRGVSNGPMALTVARSATPDLILLDINMPDMDGYEVCRHLKEEEKTLDIPIIFISALDEVTDKIQAFTAGGVDYVTKPFQFEEVLARVETHLVLRRLQNQLQLANIELERRVDERTSELVELNRALERFVPREFLSILKKESITQVSLGDQVEQTMTVMFSDIRDFTPLSERMSPQENFNFLNSLLSRVGPIIRQSHGFVDNYMGDAIMALFPEKAEYALQAAIDMLREVSAYSGRHQGTNDQQIGVGISLHTGSLMLGIIGEEERMQGTVIADAVNLASRMESLTRVYGVSIIISEQTLKHLENPDKFKYRFLDKVHVKGKEVPVSVYEVFDGDSENIVELKLKTKPDFEEGLFLYHERKFAEASVKFNSVIEHNPEDKAAKLYLRRAAHYMVQGVPTDWSGVGELGSPGDL